MPTKRLSQETPIDSADAIPRRANATFVALVDPSGGGGGSRSGRQKNWDFLATLRAWRCDDGPVVREPIIVADSSISDITLTNRMKQFPKWGIVKFTARRVPRTWLHPAVEIDRFLGLATDKELSAIKTELERPITLQDPLFGAVNFNRESQWFRTEKFISTEGLDVTFDAATLEDAGRLIKAAKPFWRARRRWFREFRQIVFDQWFTDCAASYQADLGVELTKKEFLKLLGRPCGVSFYATGEELGFEIRGWSDELFGDHGVQINGTLSGGLVR